MSGEAPRVVVFTGLPGTGKSKLADQLATELGAPAFAGDWLSGALAPYGVLTDVPRPTVTDLYRNLLGTLLTRQLLLGQSAILDCVMDDQTACLWTERVGRAGGRISSLPVSAPTRRCIAAESRDAGGTSRAGTRSAGTACYS